MVRFGVLGAGRIGKVHARTIAGSARASIGYVADALPDAAKALAAEHGAKVASVEDIIAASDVDAVLIATPTDTHADLIEAAARAGKAILCEKPVSLSVGRIEACLPVVAKAGVPLMIGFNRR
jgi:myo-inositol 2-dehydrogenase/D-chiro-inositol 1-dehydrogenase